MFFYAKKSFMKTLVPLCSTHRHRQIWQNLVVYLVSMIFNFAIDVAPNSFESGVIAGSYVDEFGVPN